VRLFFVGILPNLLPMILALGFMAMTGITVRIGTAMVLAIALGIAIDDTVHFLVGLREATNRGANPANAVRQAMTKAGSGIVYTTVVLVLGFLSMLFNELLAIRDMGLVAAVTIVVALAADLLFAPALYVVMFRRDQPTPENGACIPSNPTAPG
jgi:predicted RND superfamily exporter protein